MKIRFYNAKILQDTSKPQIDDGELWVENDVVSYIGGKTGDSDEQFDREIDSEGNLLMPGLKNAHTHSPMTFLRSYADDLPLDKWLFEKIFPLEAKLTPDDIYKLTKLAVLEYAAGGTTAAFDMYYEPEAVACACKELGFRLVFCGAVNDFKESVKKLDEYYAKYNKYNPLISYKLGFHAEYTTGVNTLREISELARDKKAPVYSHNSETANETADCVKRHGKTPTGLFSELGLYDFGGGGYHCVYLTDADIEIMKSKGVWVITNPASNLKLASGIAPVQKLINNGVKVAIGTDGPASNNSLNMWREMYLTTVLQKYLESDAAACPANDVLDMAARRGALAMGLSDCDTLYMGKQADLIMVDLNRPNMQPLNNTVKNLVYSGSDSNVILTMVAGRILYEKGEFFVGENAHKIYEDANNILKSKI